MRAISGRPRSEPPAWRPRLAALLFVSSLAWAALLWWAPFALASQSPGGRRLAVPVASYVVGRMVCHQRRDRSLSVAGRRQPVCARCAGLYAGAPAGLFCGFALARWRGRRSSGGVTAQTARRVVIWAAAPTAISIVVEWAQLGQPVNGARFLLAVAPGAAVGWLAVAVLLGLVDERVE